MSNNNNNNNNNINSTITLGDILDQTNMGTTTSSTYLEDILTQSMTSTCISTGAGGSGSIYTIDGNSNMPTWSDWNSVKPTTRIEANDIVIGDRSLTETLDKLEKRLAVFRPNPELESRWDELRDLRERYLELEQDILEKEKIMRTLSR